MNAANEAGHDGRGGGAPVVSKRDLLAGLRDVGVSPGMTLFVHSSLSSMGWVAGGEHTVIDALLEAVGDHGLLAMPTLSWDTVNVSQPVFHQRLTPSTVGRVTEAFRRRPGVKRSLHPTHSVAAYGDDALEFTACHERYSTPCPRPSPYGRLVERGGSVLLLGVGLESFTLMHGFEEWSAVPWLFNRVEQLWVIADGKEPVAVPSQRHTNVPHYEARDYPSLEPALRDGGAISYGRVGAATARLVSARLAADCLVPLISADPDVLLANKALGGTGARGKDARPIVENVPVTGEQ